MTNLVAAALLLVPQIAPTPRLRSVRPNGARLCVEAAPSSSVFSLNLFMGGGQTVETSATHGLRHLWEHLMVRGKAGSLDERLEAKGVFLRAETTRWWVRFEIVGPKGGQRLALDALRELLQPRSFTDDAVRREATILSRESDLISESAQQAARQWKRAYGDMGLDPVGEPPALSKVEASNLDELHRRLTSPTSISLSLAGPLDVDAVSREAERLLDGLSNEKGVPAEFAAAEPIGLGSGWPVKALGDSETLSSLAAALALAEQAPGVSLFYTPSPKFGLIVLSGQLSESNRGKLDVVSGFTRGRTLLVRYLGGSQNSARDASYWRGLVGLIAPKSSLESLKAAAKVIDEASFRKAWDEFVRRLSRPVEQR